MPAFKPAYLVHGDDHGRLAERRARLRALAEAESGQGGVEVLDGDACTPGAVAAAIGAMTFAIGRRFVIAEGVESWREQDVAPVAEALRAADPACLTVAFFGRDEGRARTPAALAVAVTAVGGAVHEEQALKAWELPRWLQGQARALGFELDQPGARQLVLHVGERRPRLQRELEKLALEHPPGAVIGVDDVDAACAHAVERKAWELADTVAAGNHRAALRTLLELRGQGERMPSLTYQVVKRLRDAHAASVRLAAGEPAASVKRSLRMPPKAAERFVEAVGARDPGHFRRALARMDDLEAELRGHSALAEDTAAVLALADVTRAA